jgi:Rps23 Pro-64 3,4-dihydroxylase Tpa1-like proline 4-hydroxylase
MVHEIGSLTCPLRVTRRDEPFPHFQIAEMLDAELGAEVLQWLRLEAPWRLRIESFYEQYEFSLLTDPPPRHLGAIVSEMFVDQVRGVLVTHLHARSELQLVDISVHKLVPGQTIRIHTDHLQGEETHRLLIQLNSGWELAKGGILMLFGSSSPDDLVEIFEPKHGSAFGFAISERSFHAVSTIRDGERFTLVYTFREAG